MLSPPSQLWTEIQRTPDTQAHTPLDSLTCAVATHCNTHNSTFTTSKRICVCVHRASALFTLHLAVKTFNACVGARQNALTLREINESVVCSDVTSSRCNEAHTLYVWSTSSMLTRESFQRNTQHNQNVILVFDVPTILSGNKWTCAYVVFPCVENRATHSEFTAVLRIFQELQSELGTVPTHNVQQSALLTFSHWIQSFLWKHRTLVKGIEEYVINHCAQQRVSLSSKTPDHTNTNVSVFHYICTSAEMCKRIHYVVADCSSAWETTVLDGCVEFRLEWSSICRTHTPNDPCLLRTLPEHSSDGVETSWVPSDSFVDKWFPSLHRCLNVLDSVLSEE